MRRTYLLRFVFIFLLSLTGCQSNSNESNTSIFEGERFPDLVELTTSDIEWFRDFGVSWIFAENGAPAIILPGLTLESQGELYDSGKDAQTTLYDFERVFMVFAVHSMLKAGLYALDPQKIIGDLPINLPAQSEFELTETHIALIRNAWWRDGFIDFKYPYGNYQYYQADMALKLGHSVPKNKVTGVFELTESDQDKYQTLHRELLFAVQTFIQHAEIEPGIYQLPVDGWESSIVRLQPPTKQQIKDYVHNATQLKKQSAQGKGDNVIDWMALNQRFAEVIESTSSKH